MEMGKRKSILIFSILYLFGAILPAFSFAKGNDNYKGVALLSNGIPFAKLLKIKSAIKALGGTVATVQKIKSYYDKYRFNGFSRTKSLQKAVESASKGLSNDIKGALLDFFNLSNVVANCT